MALPCLSKRIMFSPSIGSSTFKICYPSLAFYTGFKANNCISILAKTLMRDFLLYYCCYRNFLIRVKTSSGSVDYCWRMCDANLMHGSNLEMVRCCEGIEALSGKV